MKFFVLGVSVLFAFGCLNAQERVWQPGQGLMQVPIWPGVIPDAKPVAGPERMKIVKERLVAGEPWIQVDRISQPTMTVYPPKGKNTGAAVVVFPGGGYQILAMDLEGTEVCDWLTSKGVTCVLLKYRVPGEGQYEKASGCYPKSPMALEDAQRTLGLVRFHAAKWHIDPHKIGVLGFSAGGHLVTAISTHFDKRLYPVIDQADQESCRPDFAIAIYPGHMLEGAASDFGLNPAVPVTSATPPTFLLHAEDDPVDDVKNSLVYYAALKQAKVPAEMHLYAQGKHAFGLRPTDAPITKWPRLVETWLETIGMVPAQAK